MSQIPKNSISNWYIRTELGETRGPFTLSQLKELLAAGRITTTTQISNIASGNFQPLSALLGVPSKSMEPPPLKPLSPAQETITKSPHIIVAVIATVTLALIGILAFAMNSTNEAFSSALLTPPDAQASSSPALPNTPAEANPPAVENQGNKIAEKPIEPIPSPKEATPSEISLSSEELIAKTEKSVCLIKSDLSSGSGFVIEEDKVMTNRHVIEGVLVDEIEVLFPSDPNLSTKGLTAQILYEDDKLDVAILKIPSIKSTPLVIDRETKGRFRRGRDIIAIGSPGVSRQTSLTLKNAVSRGLLSSEMSFDGIEYYQASISINLGNSGGPILDLTGKVVGMVTLKGATVEGIAYAVPAYSLIDIIDSPDINPQSLDEKSLELINKQHDARVITQRISRLTIAKLIRFETYVGNVFKGINEHNLEAQQAFDLAGEIDAQSDHSMYDKLEAMTSRSIPKISSSRFLDNSVRVKIAELWGIFRETRRYAEMPEGSANSMRIKVMELKDRFIRIRNELDALLGQPDL